MDALQAISSRHSVRKFKAQPISKADLEKLVDAGRLAPTARNEQPWEFVVITSREGLRQVGEITDYGKFVAEASACIAVFCRDTKYYLEDGCAATTNILIAATALGIQSCWVAGDKKLYAQKICHVLDAPPNYQLVSLIALGYAAGHVKAIPKRDLSKVIHWDKFCRECQD